MSTVRSLRRLSILLSVEDLASAQMAGIAGASKSAANSMGAAGASADRAGHSLRGLAIATSMGVIALRRLSRTGIQIDRTFATIETTMGASSEEMDAIREQATRLGRDMPVQMREVADAMEQLAYAGFEVEEAIAASSAVTNLAVAAQMDMGAAAKMVTQQMNAFNIEAESAGQITDSMAAIFADSAIEMETLGNSMQYLSATASSMGFSFTESAAAIGVLSDNALEGSMAGTALNQALSQMTSGAESTERAMAAAGLTMDDFTDEEGEMLPMVEIFAIISERLDELNAKGPGLQRWMEDMFGRRGMRAAMPIVENIEDFEEKIRLGARAEMTGLLDRLDEFNERELAEKQLLLNAEDVEEMERWLEQAEDEDVLELASAEGFDIDDDPVTVIEQMRGAMEEGLMDEDDVADRLEAAFDFETQVAQELADDLANAEKSTEDLAEAWLDAVDAQDLATAQMDTVGGKIEYLRGSLQSLAYTMYQGFEPALSVILDGFIKFTDILSEHQTLLRAVGLALFSVTSILAIMTAHTLAVMSASFLLNSALWSNTVALVTMQSAAWPLVAVALVLAAAWFAYQNEMWIVADVVDTVIDSLRWLYDAVEEHVGVVNALLIALGPLGWALLFLREVWNDVRETAEETRETVEDVIGAVTDLADKVGITSNRIERLSGWMRELADWSKVAAYAVLFLAGAIGLKLAFSTASMIVTTIKAIKAFYALSVLLGSGGLLTKVVVLSGKIKLLGAKLAAIAGILGKILIPAIIAATKFIGGLVFAMGVALVKAAGAAAIAIGGLAVAFWPITVVILAILALTIAWQRNWLGLADRVEDVTDRIESALAPVVDRLHSVGSALELITRLLSPFGLAMLVGQEAGERLGMAIRRLIGALRELATGANLVLMAFGPLGWFLIAYRENVLGFADAVNTAVDQITGSASRAVGSIGALSRDVLGFAKRSLEAANISERASARVSAGIGYITDRLADFGRGAVAFITRMLESANAVNILLLALGPLGWILIAYRENFLGFADSVDSFIERARGAVDIVDVLSTALVGLAAPLVALQGGYVSTADVIENASQRVRSALSILDPREHTRHAGRLFGAVKSSVETLTEPLETLEEMLDTVHGWIERIASMRVSFRDIIEEFALVEWIVDRVNSAIETVQRWLGHLEDLTPEFDSVIDAIRAILSPLDRLIGRIETAIELFERLFGLGGDADDIDVPSDDDDGDGRGGDDGRGGPIGGAGLGLMGRDPWGPEGAFGGLGDPIGMPGGGLGMMAGGGMGGVGRGAMAQADRSQTMIQGGDGGMMLDNRHVNLEQAPSIDITASGQDIDRGAVSREIEQGMERSQDQAVNRMIDLFRMSTGSTPEGDYVGGSSPGGDDVMFLDDDGEGEGINEEDLPEDWDEWSEEEQQEWLDENQPDPEDGEGDPEDGDPEDGDPGEGDNGEGDNGDGDDNGDLPDDPPDGGTIV
jgi:TP901 family phage tail tape measure protein